MKKSMLLVLFTIFVFAHSYAQPVSIIDKYQNQYGTNVLTRISASQLDVITYYELDVYTRCFMVLHGNLRKCFYINENYDPSLYNSHSSYDVKDLMQIGTTCYFCGTKRTETGQWIYNPDGSITMEVLYDGFIGKFDVNDVLGTGGNMEILLIDKTLRLDKIVTCPNGVMSIGTTKQTLESCIVELHEYSDPFAPTTYSYRVMRSSYHDEMFKDITNNKDTVCIVSRFKNGSRPNAFKYYFGLRYGNGRDYYNTNNGIYYYNTQNVLPNEAATFTGVDPIHISSMRTNKAVVVAYLNTVQSNRQGFPILYKINAPGNSISKTLVCLNSCKYDTLLDMEFSIPSREYTYSAMLLKDEFGKSVLRFPDWNINSPMPDTLLISPTYKFQSISPIQQLSACVLYSGGYDPLDSYNVLNLQQWSIHFHVRTCLEKQIEVLESYNNIVDPIWEECALVTVSYKNDLFFETYPFESRIVTKESVCTKY